MNVLDVMSKIEAESAAVKDARFVRVMNPGDVVRQGDLYIERMEKDYKLGKELKSRQLAPGTSKGSRHTAEGELKVYAPLTRDPLIGPTVVADERWEVAHPEHANKSLPTGIYRIGYQKDEAAEERRRVMD